jgi:predicted dehydrogenase
MKKLKYGLIGCGDIAQKRVAPAIGELENCELVAVNRARYELAEEFAQRFGAQRWHRTWRELISDSEVEAVYVATPHNQHMEQTIACAEAGKHVLCEKPMALNARDCRAMIDACKSNKVKLGIAYYRHFYPSVIRVKELIDSGELGKVSMVQINAFEWSGPGANESRPWAYGKSESGGGPMMDFGCHRMEVLMHLLGPVKKTIGLIDNVVYDREVEDNSVALFHFKSGTFGVLCVSHSISESCDTLDIYGSKGSVHVPVLNKGSMVIKTKQMERCEEHPPHPNLHLPLVKDFTAAVLEGREPAVNGEIGYAVQLLEDRIYADSV